jgi:hypothetical protein
MLSKKTKQGRQARRALQKRLALFYRHAFVFIAEGFFLRSKKCVAKKQSKQRCERSKKTKARISAEAAAQGSNSAINAKPPSALRFLLI